VKLFVPTWFGFSPIRGYLAFVFVGVHEFSSRSDFTFVWNMRKT